MSTIVIIAVICLVAGFLIRSVPGLMSIGYILLALYFIQLGSHDKLPLLTDLIRGVELLLAKWGLGQ
jgi:hypothetical protein